MTQLLLLSFRDVPVDSKPVDKVIRDKIGILGAIRDFPVATDLALFQSTDQLMAVADDLGRLDITASGLLTRTARNIADITKKVKQETEKGWSDICPGGTFETLTAPSLDVIVSDGSSESLYTLDEYIQHWAWDEFQLAKKGTMINELYTRCNAEVQRLEEELRNGTTLYTDATNRVINFRRRDEGNLLVRNLDKIGSGMREVKTQAEYRAGLSSSAPIYVHTRNISTILVVVKKGQAEDFERSYDLGQDFVVPLSLQKLHSDNEFICYSVSLLTPNIDEYKSATKERQWHVRDFAYNPRMSEELAREAERTVAGYIEEAKKYVELLETTFSHLAIFWVHIKAVRIFVEATLLYGIETRFRSYLVIASPKNVTKIHKQLSLVFDDGMTDAAADDAVGEDSEYHPYVSFQLNLLGLVPPSLKK
jgi:V-type H+-transporting ATPase subunit C